MASCLAACSVCMRMSGAGGVSANIAAFEPYIKESEETQGGKVVILREGWLLKRSSNMRKEWKRRYFVLDSLGMLYYYSNKVLGPVTTPLLCPHVVSPCATFRHLTSSSLKPTPSHPFSSSPHFALCC